MKCWVCKRQARGFGHTDPREPVGDPAHYPADWVFCSTRCMNTFHVMYGNWRRAREDGSLPKGALMIDPSDVELAAMRKCLRHFGEAAQSIGFDKPLGEYSEAQALSVIDAIVTGYSQAMADHHEATRFPPVHGMALAADPMSQPFADMVDDRPWDEPTPVAKGRKP